MKKTLSIVILLTLAISLLTGCSKVKSDSDKISVVTTIFPIYDWTSNVIGDNDNYELSYLCDNGVDMHNFQPTAEDIANISSCDIFIYVGGESDEWVEDVLNSRVNKDMVIVNLITVLGDNALDEEDNPGEKDEHIWLSIDNAKIICQYLADSVFADCDKDNDSYSINASDYCDKLSDIKSQYEDVITNSKLDTFVVADRYPYRYLSEEFGLNYYAAFDGCSAETGASFEIILFLADKLDEINASHIATTESADGSVADAVIGAADSSDVSIVMLDSMQSITKQDVKNGTTYISVLKDNLEALKLLLN